MQIKKLILCIIIYPLILIILSCSTKMAYPNKPGDHIGSIKSHGLRRTYLLHVPISYDATKPTPIVLFFHASHRTGEEAARITNFNKLADQNNFIVVYPDGVDRVWNDGRVRRSARWHNIDDVGFAKALIDHLLKTLNIDSKRIYASGRSNGAILAYRLACEYSVKFAAIAPVAGAMPDNPDMPCSPHDPVSVIAIHGTDDKIILWDGGDAAGGRTLSVPETIKRWVILNQCPTSPRVMYEPDRDPKDGTRVKKEEYGPCKDGSEVVVYAIEGGGHTWPGGKEVFYIGAASGSVSKDIDAAEIIWDFFKKHQKR